MEPHDKSKPSYNPRHIVRHNDGLQTLVQMLISTGYVPQQRAQTDLALALRRYKAHLLFGPRGAGKTDLGESLVKACNLTLFYVPGIDGQTIEEVYGGWDIEAQREAFNEARSRGESHKMARGLKWQRDNFDPGEFLAAFEFAKEAAERGDPPPVLIVDEIEKLSTKLQNALLQPLARGWANIPKLHGVIGVKDRSQMPIIILTSNNIKLLTDPLRSRGFRRNTVPARRSRQALRNCSLPTAELPTGWARHRQPQ